MAISDPPAVRPSALETEEEVRRRCLSPHDPKLMHLLGGQVGSITKLSGGLVNYVYRVCSAAPSPSTRSLILKSYPPFIAAAPSITFSQDRYNVEKHALQLLSERLPTNTRARVPKLLHYDDSECLLVMQDAGDSLVTLMSVLERESTVAVDLDALAVDVCEFVRAMHSISLDRTQTRVFENPAAMAVLNANVHPTLRLTAQKFELEETLAQELDNIPPFRTPRADGSEEAVLTHGDLWPNSVLIDPQSGVVWVLDFEFARLGNTRRDCEQMVGYLMLMRQNTTLFDQSRITALQHAIERNFFDAAWVRSEGRRTSMVMWALVLVEEEQFGLHAREREALLAVLEEVRASADASAVVVHSSDRAAYS